MAMVRLNKKPRVERLMRGINVVVIFFLFRSFDKDFKKAKKKIPPMFPYKTLCIIRDKESDFEKTLSFIKREEKEYNAEFIALFNKKFLEKNGQKKVPKKNI